MIRIRHRIAAVVCAGLVAPVAIGASTAGAIDQDLVVSATSGTPGNVIDVSSAACAPVDDPDGDVERYLRVLLISGTGDAERLAGIGNGFGAASFIVPDWTDPGAPAVVEASCITGTYTDDGYEETAEAYDPVAFDILPGAGSPTQSSTLSRDELLVGQSFEVTGTGCGADDFAGVDLASGGDLSGRSYGDDIVGWGEGQVEGGTFDAQVDLIELSWGVAWSSNGGKPFDIQTEGGRTDIPAGAYTAISYCATYDEATDTATYLLLPPQLVDVTGNAPIDDMALDVPDGSRTGTLAGGSCTSGDVVGSIRGVDLAAFEEEFDTGADRIRVADEPTRSPARPSTGEDRDTLRSRDVGHEEFAAFAATPAPDGSWSTSETAAFDAGVLVGEAACGDTLGDGFFYDLQPGAVEVTETPVTVPPTAAPQPAGATPVAGTPTYAG